MKIFVKLPDSLPEIIKRGLTSFLCLQCLHPLGVRDGAPVNPRVDHFLAWFPWGSKKRKHMNSETWKMAKCPGQSDDKPAG